MDNDDALEIHAAAAALDPRQSVVGVRQGASFTGDPMAFLWFKSLSDFRQFALEAMPAIFRPDGLDDIEESLQEDLAALLHDQESWDDAMRLLNDLYQTDSPTHWIGKFEELAFDEDSALGSELRREFRGADDEEADSEESAADPLAEEELEGFAEFLQETWEQT